MTGRPRSRPPAGRRASERSRTVRSTSERSRTVRRGGPAATIDRLLDRQPWDALIPHLLKAGARVEPTTELLRRYARMLIEWNRSVSNLISRNDEARIVERHIAESVEPAAWLKSCPATRWLDFGSGAGLPAIPLAIAGVGPRWTLVESRRMKTLFVRKAIESLGLRDIEVVVARLENLGNGAERLEAYSGFTSRATVALGPTLTLATRFVAPGGTAFLWKGSQREQEMSADPSWQDAWEFEGLLGIGQGQTTVVRLARKG